MTKIKLHLNRKLCQPQLHLLPSLTENNINMAVVGREVRGDSISVSWHCQRAAPVCSPQGHLLGKTPSLGCTGCLLGKFGKPACVCDHTLSATLASPSCPCLWLAALFIFHVFTHTSAHRLLTTGTEPEWPGLEGTPKVISFQCHTSSACLLPNWPRLRS